MIVRILLALVLLGFGSSADATTSRKPHNVIVFVADGLRSGVVNEQSAPTFAAVRREGVDFRNSHSIYPTVTTANGSAIATGHLLGDTGNFGNSIWLGRPLDPARPSTFAGLENDDDLRALARLYDGNYLNEDSLLGVARRAGFQTAAVGKLGPAWVQDVTGASDPFTVLIDDDTGKAGARPLPPKLTAAMTLTGLSLSAPANNEQGVAKTANQSQQDWMTAAVTKALLPLFKKDGRPFALVFWSCDPDCTQHTQGDSLGTLTPGVNGPTSEAAVRNADSDLAAIRVALHALGLDKTTDIFVTADHGFATMSRQSLTSSTVTGHYPDTPAGLVPRGFFAIDMASALELKLWDGRGGEVAAGSRPSYGGALLGADAAHPDFAIASNGGTELIYLPEGPDRKARLDRVMGFLTAQDYVSAIFVDDALGSVMGALPLSRAGLVGSAKTPRPTIAVSLRSFSTGCAKPELCAAEIADTSVQQGQGTHGALARSDTHNFMAAVGPDFRSGFVDPAPVSNADIAPTLAKVLGLKLTPKGKLTGRVIAEALPGGKVSAHSKATIRSTRAANGFQTVLDTQTVGNEVYLDAAGMPGRAVGLKP